jgi:hypothetical protein
MADKTLPLDATGKLQLKLVDNGDGTYSISSYVGGITVESVTATNVGISQTEGENVVEDQALAALIGEVQATPTANTLLARVKSLEDKLGEVQASPTANTLLARLKSLEDKIDAITDGTSPAVTQLSGSKMELYGASINDRPAANTVPIGAMFNIVGTEKVWQSNGIDWVVL